MKEPEFDLLLVGADEHTTAVCREFAKWNRVRLLESSTLSFEEFQEGRENRIAVVIDDSVEHCADLLAATHPIEKHQSSIIIVVPANSLDYAMEWMARGPRTVWMKPCDYSVVSTIFQSMLSKKRGEAAYRLGLPGAPEPPVYCECCMRELSRSYLKELRERMREESNSKTAAERDRFLTMAEVERRHICWTLAQVDGDKLRAARLLGIGKTTLYRKLQEYGLTCSANSAPTEPAPPAVPESAEPLAQLAVFKKQTQSVLDKMREFERLIAGRR